MLHCKDASRLLSEEMERPLSRQERFALKMHLMICRACRRCAIQFASLRTTARHFARGRNEQTAAHPSRHEEKP